MSFFTKKFAKRQNVYYICTRKREVAHLNTRIVWNFLVSK